MRKRRQAGRELVVALERTRTRLAVAVAAEMKTTPAELWNLYRETEEKMRRRLKELRAHPRDDDPEDAGRVEALEALRRLALEAVTVARQRGEAWRLCRRVRQALECLERGETRRASQGGAPGHPDHSDF
ncbi:MAG TPA: hypothetical protein VGS98_11520 [Thermoanaerobaculia bacterium]|nr:hypothetical protein [Thermoanaerobaculia bacterium]